MSHFVCDGHIYVPSDPIQYTGKKLSKFLLLSSNKSRPHLSTYIDVIKGSKKLVLVHKVIVNLTKGC